MAEHKLSLAEKETVFLWNESDDVVQIETYSKKLIKRLHRIQEKHPTQYRVDEPDRHGCVYAEVPKNLLQITFREPVSEQRREKMSQLAKVRFFHPRMTRGGERCEAWGGATPPPTSASSEMSPIN